jgi:hypothetical protein
VPDEEILKGRNLRLSSVPLPAKMRFPVSKNKKPPIIRRLFVLEA